MPRKKVLIITYYWPPGSGPGVQRWLKFCKYLPEFEWIPTVVTVKNGSYPSIDPSLENDIPQGMKVFKTKTLEPFAIYNFFRGKKGKSVEVAMASVKGKQSLFAKFSNYIRSNFFIPDARVGWNKYAYEAAAKIIESEKPDVIITTGPPQSTHLVGLKLQKKYKVKWIADFRDPWTTIYYNQFLLRTDSSHAKDLAYETKVLNSADAIITATPGITNDLKSRAKKAFTIPNGFDLEDFAKVDFNPSEKFKLAYVGNLKPVQNVAKVWEAISELKTENKEFALKFEFEITGNMAPEFEVSFEQFGINDLVKIKKFVPHKEAIARMLESHVLFLPIPIDKDNKSILTGKIFEYLATKRPLLAIGPTHGNAAEILSQCEKSSMIDYDDIISIKHRLLHLFETYQNNPTPIEEGNNDYLNYSRKGTTKTLTTILNEFLSE